MGFSMKINLGSTKPANKYKTLPSGIYEVRCSKLDTFNETRVKFHLHVINNEQTEYNDMPISTSLKIPTSLNDSVIFYWRAAAESFGYSQEEIALRDEWVEDDFVDNNAFVEYQAPTGDGTYPKVSWLVPSAVPLARAKHRRRQQYEEKSQEKRVQKAKSEIQSKAPPPKIEIPPDPFKEEKKDTNSFKFDPNAGDKGSGGSTHVF